MRYRLRKCDANGVFSAVMIMEKISHARVTTGKKVKIVARNVWSVMTARSLGVIESR